MQKRYGKSVSKTSVGTTHERVFIHPPQAGHGVIEGISENILRPPWKGEGRVGHPAFSGTAEPIKKKTTFDGTVRGLSGYLSSLTAE